MVLPHTDVWCDVAMLIKLKIISELFSLCCTPTNHINTAGPRMWMKMGNRLCKLNLFEIYAFGVIWFKHTIFCGLSLDVLILPFLSYVCVLELQYIILMQCPQCFRAGQANNERERAKYNLFDYFMWSCGLQLNILTCRCVFRKYKWTMKRNRGLKLNKKGTFYNVWKVFQWKVIIHSENFWVIKKINNTPILKVLWAQ